METPGISIKQLVLETESATPKIHETNLKW